MEALKKVMLVLAALAVAALETALVLWLVGKVSFGLMWFLIWVQFVWMGLMILFMTWAAISAFRDKDKY